jgi:hypothetical protein
MNIGPYIFEKASKKAQELFGLELFGAFTGKEKPDTEDENALFAVLKWWVDNNNDSVGSHLFDNLYKFRKDYPDILIPKAKTIYRGTAIGTDPWHIKDGKIFNGQISLEELEANTKTQTFLNKVYTPHREYSSWTSDMTVARKFAESHAGGWSIPAVLKMATPKMSLFNENFSTKVSKEFLGVNESEIIVKGKKFKVEVWVSPDTKAAKRIDFLKGEYL